MTRVTIENKIHIEVGTDEFESILRGLMLTDEENLAKTLAHQAMLSMDMRFWDWKQITEYERPEMVPETDYPDQDEQDLINSQSPPEPEQDRVEAQISPIHNSTDDIPF